MRECKWNAEAVVRALVGESKRNVEAARELEARKKRLLQNSQSLRFYFGDLFKPMPFTFGPAAI